MKNYILTVLIIVFSFTVVGQERDINVNPFNTSSLKYHELELLRNYYVRFLEKERFYQIETVANVKYSGIYNVLMIMEQEMLLLLEGKHKRLLTVIRNNELEYFLKRNERTYLIGYMYDSAPYRFAEKRYMDKFNRAMLNYVMFNEYRLKKQVSENRKLSKSEVLFLHFYIDLLIHYNDPCNKRNEHKVLDSAKELVKRYPYNKFSMIAKKYKQFEYSFSDWSLGVNSPIGIETPISKELNKYSSTMFRFPIVALGLEVGFKQLLFYSDFSFNIHTLNTSISQVNEEKNRDFGFLYSNFGFAYRFKLNDRIEIQPYISRRFLASAYNIEYHDDYYLNPTKYESEDVSPEIYHLPYRSSSLSYGVSLEFGFGKETFCDRPFSRGYHRFQIGFSSLELFHKDRHITGSTMIFQYSIGYRLQRRKGMAWYE